MDLLQEKHFEVFKLSMNLLQEKTFWSFQVGMNLLLCITNQPIGSQGGQNRE